MTQNEWREKNSFSKNPKEKIEIKYKKSTCALYKLSAAQLSGKQKSREVSSYP